MKKSLEPVSGSFPKLDDSLDDLLDDSLVSFRKKMGIIRENPKNIREFARKQMGNLNCRLTWKRSQVQVLYRPPS